MRRAGELTDLDMLNLEKRRKPCKKSAHAAEPILSRANVGRPRCVAHCCSALLPSEATLAYMSPLRNGEFQKTGAAGATYG
jgi:hypothetical protein